MSTQQLQKDKEAFAEQHDALKSHGVVLYEEIKPALEALSLMSERQEDEDESGDKKKNTGDEKEHAAEGTGKEPRYTFTEFAEHMLSEHAMGSSCACNKVKDDLKKQGYQRGFMAGVKARKLEELLIKKKQKAQEKAK